MNPFLKRSLAIAAIAPLAFITSVGPAGAGTGADAYDYTPEFLGTFGDSDHLQFRCDHPQDDAATEGYFFDVIVDTEGDDTDLSDIDGVTILASDRDWNDNGDTDESTYHESFDDATRAKLELFKPSHHWMSERPDRIYKDTERQRASQPGYFKFGTRDEDGVGFLRATVTWDGPSADGDDDDETLTCLITDPEYPGQTETPGG